MVELILLATAMLLLAMLISINVRRRRLHRAKLVALIAATHELLVDFPRKEKK